MNRTLRQLRLPAVVESRVLTCGESSLAASEPLGYLRRWSFGNIPHTCRRTSWLARSSPPASDSHAADSIGASDDPDVVAVGIESPVSRVEFGHEHVDPIDRKRAGGSVMPELRRVQGQHDLTGRAGEGELHL